MLGKLFSARDTDEALRHRSWWKRGRVAGRRSTPARRPVALEPLEQRTLLAAFFVDGRHCLPGSEDGSSAQPFCTIQRGIDAAAATAETNDVVTVGPGRYHEQLDISSPMTVVGSAARRPVLKAPAVVPPVNAAGSRPIIFVHDTGGVLLRLLVVDGRSALATNPGLAGVSFRNASGKVVSSEIRNINAPGAAIADGAGVMVSADHSGERVSLKRSLVHGYQAVGVVGDGPVDVRVSNNTLTGAGPTGLAIQYGVQLSSGAIGVVRGNTISDHEYTPDPLSAAGVLLDGAADGVRVTGNVFQNNEVGIFNSSTNNSTLAGNVVSQSTNTGVFVERSAGVRVSGNTVTTNAAGATAIYVSRSSSVEIMAAQLDGTGWTDAFGIVLQRTTNSSVHDNAIAHWDDTGIVLDAASVSNSVVNNVVAGSGNIGIELGVDSTGNTVSGNQVSGSGVHDARDRSAGEGTAGTGNTWQQNQCGTELPAGLCS
jgi:parallel beta-helix repeat protein